MFDSVQCIHIDVLECIRHANRIQLFGLVRGLFAAGRVVDNPHGELIVVPPPWSEDSVLEGVLFILNEFTLISKLRIQLIADGPKTTKADLSWSDYNQLPNVRADKTNGEANRGPLKGEMRTHVIPEIAGMCPSTVHSVIGS